MQLPYRFLYWLVEIIPLVRVHMDEAHRKLTDQGSEGRYLVFLINGFFLVLATIVTSLEKYLKLSPTDNTEILGFGGQDEATHDRMDGEAYTHQSGRVSRIVKAKQPDKTSEADKGFVPDKWTTSQLKIKRKTVIWSAIMIR